MAPKHLTIWYYWFPRFLISPGILQKVYGARDSSVARKAVLLNALGLLLFAMLPPMLGVIAHGFYPELQNRELALPTLMVHQMPFWIGALALAAVFSAELSAADAVLAMLSTSFARDWCRDTGARSWTLQSCCA